jgi:hypothetical protein
MPLWLVPASRSQLLRNIVKPSLPFYPCLLLARSMDLPVGLMLFDESLRTHSIFEKRLEAFEVRPPISTFLPRQQEGILVSLISFVQFKPRSV